MPQEIERKFLVESDAWRAAAGPGRRLRQAYLAETDRAVVRVRTEDGARAMLTIKSAAPGLAREELEYPVPLDHANSLVEMRQGAVLEKTRYAVSHGGHVWDVDVYDGENAGLVVAEVAVASEAEAASVPLPGWLGREVTGERRYYAARLSQHPFAAWSEAERGGGA